MKRTGTQSELRQWIDGNADMNFLLCIQVLLVAAAWLVAKASPIPQTSEGPVFAVPESADFPAADQIGEEKSIRTNVIGKMEDLEVTTWISNLSDLNFTFPPDMVVSLGLQDFVD